MTLNSKKLTNKKFFFHWHYIYVVKQYNVRLIFFSYNYKQQINGESTPEMHKFLQIFLNLF